MNEKTMSLRDALIERGVPHSAFNSVGYKAVEALISEGIGVDGLATARREVDSLRDTTRDTAIMIEKSTAEFNKEICTLQGKVNAANTKLEQLESLEKKMAGGTIRDEKLIDALNLYTAILRNTKEIFGEENLTEAVMVKLLETASYGVWRSIMGPKGEKNDTTSPSRKYERI